MTAVTAGARGRSAAREDGDLMPVILDAVRVEARLGEICGALGEV